MHFFDPAPILARISSESAVSHAVVDPDDMPRILGAFAGTSFVAIHVRGRYGEIEQVHVFAPGKVPFVRSTQHSGPQAARRAAVWLTLRYPSEVRLNGAWRHAERLVPAQRTTA